LTVDGSLQKQEEIMETIINIIQTISDNRFWLLPVLLAYLLCILAIEIKGTFIDM